MTSGEPSVAMRGVSKAYGPTRALSGVNLALFPGEIAALLGENGAGKSTAAKILCGLESPDDGELQLDGKTVELGSPRAAAARGIYFIPQELAYVPNMTVAENIMLGNAPHRFGFTAYGTILSSARAQAEKFGFHLDLNKSMAAIPIADVQMVEILKALRVGARAIVLDEPTSSLTQDESARLFTAVRELAEGGTAIAFISHRLDEVLDGSDVVHVFRDGRVVSTVRTSETTREDLLAKMLGHPFTPLAATGETGAGSQTGLAVAEWPISGDKRISIDFQTEEVTVAFGLRGSGAGDFAAALAGDDDCERGGTLQVAGGPNRRPRTPGSARRAGISYVPPDRRRQGLLMHLSVGENVAAYERAVGGWRFWRRPSAERNQAVATMSTYGVRAAGPGQAIGELSGGNQQKVLLASRLLGKPSVLVLQEPTRGVDVGARDEIHRILRDYTRSGAVVVVVTSDFEEALQLGDRILVFRRGRLVGDLRGLDRNTAIELAKGTDS